MVGSWGKSCSYQRQHACLQGGDVLQAQSDPIGSMHVVAVNRSIREPRDMGRADASSRHQLTVCRSDCTRYDLVPKGAPACWSSWQSAHRCMAC